jgi:hypothetical protein
MSEIEIDRITEYAAPYALHITRSAVPGLYNWQVVQNDGLWMREVRHNTDLLPLDCSLVSGRAALQSCADDMRWCQRMSDTLTEGGK